MTPRFETKAELRRQVERQTGSLSDKEWAQLEPDWSEPYGDGDLAEVLDAAREFASQAARVSKEFVADVQRLRAELLKDSYGPGPIQVDALEAIWMLWNVIHPGYGSQAFAEVASLNPQFSDVASMHSKLGLAVHEFLAADWLVHRYGIEWTASMEVLDGTTDPGRVKLNLTKEGESGFSALARVWGHSLRSVKRFMEPVRRDFDQLARRRQTATEALLLDVLEARGKMWKGWERGRVLYERMAAFRERDWTERGEPLAFKRFWNKDSFRMAARRAESKSRS